jgi:branched-chain amino acid transport system ATP-binding protein
MTNLLLEISHLSVNYGAIQAVQDLDLEVYEGEIVTLIGANGAGKSTTLRAISRIIDPRQGKIFYAGRNITHEAAHRIVKLGIAHSPEGRRVLTRQTVLANLELGAFTRSARRTPSARNDSITRNSITRNSITRNIRSNSIAADIQQQFQTFPRLEERKHQLAGTLSGGEQQMLAIARALMSRPRLLLLDEPSLGLAPQIVREIFSVIRQLREAGVTILLVEQNANMALQIADRAYILEAGRRTVAASASELLTDERVRAAYLG